MSWNSGTHVMATVMDTMLKHVPDAEARKAMYRDVVPALADHDWHDHYDLFGIDQAYDDVVTKELYPGRWDYEDCLRTNQNRARLLTPLFSAIMAHSRPIMQ